LGANVRIAVVEDEVKLAELLKKYLEHAGYDVDCFHTGSDALASFRKSQPHLAILDLMLPDTDGYEICKQLKQLADVPVIMLTAKVSEEDRLRGFEVGTDDYVCKPFSPKEVVARVKSWMKRSYQRTQGVDILSLGPLMIKNNNREAYVNDIAVGLTTKEFMLLHCFASHPTQVFSREQLIVHLNDEDNDSFDRVIDSHIKNMRKKLNAALPGAKVIQSVYGAGYKLVFPFQ
jgi:two-component system response regulator BaeR